jgi:hypothetical protein
MTIRGRDIDALEGALRDYVQALMDHRDGRISGAETVVQAQTNLREKLRTVLGLKVAEDAEP